MRRLALVPTLIAALLLPSGAHALGLGNIEIQSALNQRLDAEIPLRGVPSGRSGEIEVSLASEEAFENVGLDRPFALTRLQFTVKERGGDYYVHVTSNKSIVEPFLSFLVQVDWPGGNLLREYTVLLDPPVFASEEESGQSGGATDTAETSAAGDGAGTTGEIERDAESSRTERDTGDGMAAESGGDTRSASAPEQAETGRSDDKPVFLQVEEREERAERARAEAERAEAEAAGDGGSGSRSAGAPERYGPVAEGETLWSIASRLKSGDMTVQQMMIALLRYNPDAFAGENINRLKQGYVLRVPDSDRVLAVSAQRALARVREQNGAWRELQEGARTRTSVAASEQGSGDAGASGTETTGTDDAELSIVGADEGGASSDEAASATGSSSADESEKLQLVREELESTRIEKEELESRVNELEQTVSKMEKLLELRDERLSALQEELRKLEGRQAEDEDAGSESDDEAGMEVATADEADGEGVDEDDAAAGESATAGGDAEDEETVAAADGDMADGEDAGATGADSGSGGDGSTATGDGEAADTTASADAADDGQTEATETAAGADEQADGSYVPEDKRVTEADRGVQTTRTQEPEETWLDKVNGAVAAVTGVFAGLGGGLLGGPVGLGLAAAIVLLGGGLILMRRRREAAESADLEEFEPVAPDADIAPFDADSSGHFEAQGQDAGGGEDSRAASTADAESALMAEEFDVGSLDDEASTRAAAAAVADEPAGGGDDEEAEKDDTVAEADVYLAYGLHQQAEDLLRLALREQSGNAMYQEKLLETLYASGKTEEFIEEAKTFRGLVAGPESRLWQRVLAMGRDLAPRHELFAEGETAYTAADVQPARPAGTDIDFGLDDEPATGSGGDRGGSAGKRDDDFTSTMMLDSGDFEAVEGDAGLVGPEEDGSRGQSAGTGTGDADEDEDLEFDLGDLEGLTGEPDAPAASGPESSGPDPAADESGGLDFDLDDEITAESGDSVRADAGDDDGALDFDLDFDERESPQEGLPTAESGDTGQSEPPAGAGTDDGELDFDFDLEETAEDSGSASVATGDPEATEPAGGADDEPLEIGDLDIGDLDALETESAPEPGDRQPAAPGDPGTAAGDTDTEAFDLSDLESELGESPEEPSADRTAATASTGDDDAAADDAFDLSDLDALGGAQAGDDGTFNLDDPGASEPAASTGTETAPPAADSTGAEAAAASTEAESAPDEDEEFDTMLDLARAYIDMGDPESAANALEEVASAGNERQRGEAQSLLESVR